MIKNALEWFFRNCKKENMYEDEYYLFCEYYNDRHCMHRYHIHDNCEWNEEFKSKVPKVVDLEKEYPNNKLSDFKYVCENGYIYVALNDKKLFMSMHCPTNTKEEAEEYKEFLIDLRYRKKDDSIFDILD